MSGLRERQKEQRRASILDAALALFDANGYNATTVEQIAASAGVSAPTVFNYFGNKQEILLALLDRAAGAEDEGISEAWEVLSGIDDPVDILCTLYSLVSQRELDALPISIWRELLNFSFNTSISKEVVALNERLTAQIALLLEWLQKQGKFRGDFDAAFVASFLNDYSALVFARLVQSDEPDFAAHENHIRAVAEIVFNGLRPQ
ncbi:TetR/AcrR family transcriptional regulator [Pseudomonas citronellolis]|uniref:TetR/AcrR family transcriptional regulator n=1 Tax=Pseudomonas citronellolis TaxID=53408 RepID=UPI00226E20E2|nr:TetR/AcrR family transcriptional regulator [Pseudomonas citronellolis]WAB90275.1 TetR/AcrR family transcriptional regulator [Pseudomonas citronellolis]